MFGIIGVVEKFEIESFIKFLSKIFHRGARNHSNLSLGHQRLFIQGLFENGHQPVFSAVGNWIISKNNNWIRCI